MQASARWLRQLWPVTLMLALAACASAPQSQYYTLSPPLEGRVAQEPPSANQPRLQPFDFVISVQTARVPEQYDRPQIVLTTAGSNEVTLLNHSLWAATLPEEIRHAVAYHLTQRLGVLDLPLDAIPSKLPVWEVNLDIQRFDSVWAQEAILDVTWRLTPRNMGAKAKGRLCGAEIRVPATAGVAPLVESHRKALESLSAVIAGQLSGNEVLSDPTVKLKGCAS